MFRPQPEMDESWLAEVGVVGYGANPVLFVFWGQNAHDNYCL